MIARKGSCLHFMSPLMLVALIALSMYASDLSHKNTQLQNTLKSISHSVQHDLEALDIPGVSKASLGTSRVNADGKVESGSNVTAVDPALYRKAMVYVEPRQQETAMHVLSNFNGNMPSDWDLVIVHSPSNEQFMRDRVNKLQLHGRIVQFKRLLPDEFTSAAYNGLFLSVEFWDNFEQEHLLVFQSDAVLCSNSPFQADHFTQYDYIGCGYANSHGEATNFHWAPWPFYGVGGLSMRSNSFQKRCLESEELHHYKSTVANGGEDVFFSMCLHHGYGRRPESAKTLRRFCNQQVMREPSFGVHKFWSQMYEHAPSNTKPLIKHCPEALVLRPEAPLDPQWKAVTSPHPQFNVKAWEKRARKTVKEYIPQHHFDEEKERSRNLVNLDDVPGQ
ncbi:hypothetical protein SARC_00416 [Sphaeroforma arctica JP610]|uniref:DUF5672 domain-containing protein n=1 Tax=Sphaeroforma arctica JP610 TaxID=667725 RepID=A0A0L0GEN4_9EUKA|nr:hypothetical protein SARC_00416 [Sphaeroforma arctica JP610]KNC87482.1 hypothetical protein SARC_00416 [Sphaeroforma arctica JP610]|eukprot:XP_014161384.1 hypothetical protein SARC_00416 [Sphaeroforma arctica JP610]